ncbi:MAG TPA: hypothetical protein VKE69_15075 [Planctomycetota bacterium]|nr:hypothetical protein [Planctomycetota bacterium]
MARIRHLVRLRWKYTWRGASASRRGALIIGSILSVVFSVLLAVSIGSLLRGLARSGLGEEAIVESSVLGFTILYFGWLYLGASVQLFDPQAFAVYPISPRTLFLGSCLSTAVGYAPFYATGITVGLLAGRPAPPGTTIARIALLALFFAHLVMLSRLVRLAFLQFLTSRRWRDIAVVLSALLGVSGYAASQALGNGERLQHAALWLADASQSGAFTRWLCWSPGAWFAHAYELDGAVSWVALASFAAVTVVVAFLGARVEERLAFSEPVFTYTPRDRRSTGAPRRFLRGFAARIGAAAGSETGAVARKELLVLGRDPTVRARLLANAVFLVVPAIGSFVRRGRGGLTDLLGFALIVLELAFLLNILGTDGSALRAVAATPIRRWKIVLGKNVAHTTVFLTINLAILTVLSVSFGNADGLGVLLPFHAAQFAITVGAGSVFSMFFPMRIVVPGRRLARADSDRGFGRAFLSLAALLGIGALAAPLFLLQHGRAFLGSWWAPLAVCGFLYAAAAYVACLFVAGKLLEEREERLVAYFARA